MLRSIAGTAGALSLALLVAGGCSRDDVTPAGTEVAPVAVPSASAGIDPAPGASAPAGVADDTVPQPGEVETPMAPPSRAVNQPFPDPASALSGWTDATVTRGSGSCFGLQDADGVAWAVYSKKAVPLKKGDRVRARLTPGKTPVSCGEGKAATLERVLIAEN